MKNTITRKILAAAAALMVMTTMTGCFGKPAAPAEDNNPTAVTTPADVSGSDISGSDVSGSDISGSDVVVVDDETASNAAIDAYFACFNSGDAAGLANLTCSPAISSFLLSSGYSKDFVAQGFAGTIEEMKKAAGGNLDIRYEYTVADAGADQLAALKADLSELTAGAGDNVQAARVYQVTMKLVAATSASDVASGADVQVLEQSDCELVAYKYDGNWYIHSN